MHSILWHDTARIARIAHGQNIRIGNMYVVYNCRDQKSIEVLHEIWIIVVLFSYVSCGHGHSHTVFDDVVWFCIQFDIVLNHFRCLSKPFQIYLAYRSPFLQLEKILKRYYRFKLNDISTRQKKKQNNRKISTRRPWMLLQYILFVRTITHYTYIPIFHK